MQICNFFMFFDITLKNFHILLSILNYLKKMAFQIKHYAPTSLITSNLNANVFYDCDGAEQLFERPQLRRQLSLNEAQPTNPQSEALCDSIIHPDFILDVQVDSQKSFNWLSKQAIKSEVSLEYFSPRSDFEYWKARTVAS